MPGMTAWRQDPPARVFAPQAGRSWGGRGLPLSSRPLACIRSQVLPVQSGQTVRWSGCRCRVAGQGRQRSRRLPGQRWSSSAICPEHAASLWGGGDMLRNALTLRFYEVLSKTPWEAARRNSAARRMFGVRGAVRPGYHAPFGAVHPPAASGHSR